MLVEDWKLQIVIGTDYCSVASIGIEINIETETTHSSKFSPKSLHNYSQYCPKTTQMQTSITSQIAALNAQSIEHKTQTKNQRNSGFQH